MSKGVTWDFDGRQMQAREIARINYHAGFVGHDALIRSVAIVLAESQGWTEAWHKNIHPETGAVLSTDWTWWQINDHSWPEILGLKGGLESGAGLLAVAKLAHEIYREGTFKRWAAHHVRGRDGLIPADKQMLRAINGVCNFEKERRGFPIVH